MMFKAHLFDLHRIFLTAAAKKCMYIKSEHCDKKDCDKKDDTKLNLGTIVLRGGSVEETTGTILFSFVAV